LAGYPANNAMTYNSLDMDNFYSMDENILKHVFGDKLHYHWPIGNDANIGFDQAVIDLFPYIKYNSKILDCGCGWGGPARLLKERLNCEVTGVTISKSQAKYCEDIIDVVHKDLHDYYPTQQYDTALFMESYTHLTDGAKVLNNIKGNVQEIVIKDYCMPETIYHENWHMTIRSEKMFYSELESAGYKIKEFYTEPILWDMGINYWYNNLIEFDIEKLPRQLQILYNFCMHYKTYGNTTKDVSLCIIHASRS